MRTLLLIAATLLAAACARGLDHRIDGSSEAGLKASLAKVRESASAEDVKALEDAMRALAVTDLQVGFEGGILGALEKVAGRSPESLAETLLAEVHGKTGREIVAAADKRKRDLASRQLAEANAEIAALRKARTDKEAAKDKLALVQVLDPRMALTGSAGSRMAILDFKVRNGTEELLANLSLRAIVTRGDGVDVLTDDFVFRSATPMLPRETLPVRLPNTAPGKWNSPELAKQQDLSLKILVLNADLASGGRLAASFEQKEAERLALLERQKPRLEALAGTK